MRCLIKRRTKLTLLLLLGMATCSRNSDIQSKRQADRNDPLPIPPNSIVAPDTETISGTVVSAGSLSGSAQVTPDGAARYSVPLWVSPGRRVQPELSLEYSSRGGNGILGVGW